MVDEHKPDLKPDTILDAEFGYVADTAFQANEDRAKVSSFFLTAVASLGIAILSQDDASRDIYPAFMLLFLVLSAVGMLTILELTRLRTAWADSARTMNQIKKFYIEHLQQTGMDLNGAFRWGHHTLPPLYKPWSLGFLQALQVALLGGTTLGGFFLFLLAWLQIEPPELVVGLSVGAGIIYTCALMGVYRGILKKANAKAAGAPETRRTKP